MAFQAGEFASASMDGSSAPTAAHALVRVGSSLGLLVILGEHLAPGGSESCPAPTSGVACLGLPRWRLRERVGTLSSCFVMHSPCLLWSILGQAGLDACATLVHAMAAGRKNEPLLGISALFLWLLPSQFGALGVWWHMSSGQ